MNPFGPISRVFAVLVFGLGLAGAENYFDDGRTNVATPERYRSPAWGELDWRPQPVAETLLAGAGVFDMALAVGSNFHGDEAGTAPFVRSMALAIAYQLQPDSRSVKLADYQLKFRREPAAVGAWPEREALAESLWKSAWSIHRTDAETGLTLLDLAAAFDPTAEEAIGRYRELSGGSMEGRWLAAVRLPDGIDAPDIAEEVIDAAAVLAEVAAEVDEGTDGPSAEKTEAFQLSKASLQVPADDGGLVRLVAEVVTYDDATMRERKQMMIRQRKAEAKERGVKAQPYVAPALEMDFRIGTANGDAAPMIMTELAKARSAFVRSRPEAKFAPGLGVEFEIADGRAPAEGGILSAAAGVLLESMAEGIALSEEAGAAGQLGFGLKFQSGKSSLAGSLRRAEEGGDIGWLAVPDSVGEDAVDMAALGDLNLLMEIQLLACRDVTHAVQLLGAESNLKRQLAFERFAEIGHAAKRTPAETLVRKPDGEGPAHPSLGTLSRAPVRGDPAESL